MIKNRENLVKIICGKRFVSRDLDCVFLIMNYNLMNLFIIC